MKSSSSSSRAVIERYSMRDQATSTGSHRRSMLIGKLHDGQGLWVSFDKRGDSYHPRYWNDASKSQSLVNLKGKVNFAKGLELSQFSSKKRANRQKPHQDKQKLLIRQVYHQGGVLHEGDLENVEALQAAKDEAATQRRKILNAAKMGKNEENKEDRGEEEGDVGEEGGDDEEEWAGVISTGSEGEEEMEVVKEGEENEKDEEEWAGIISTGSEGEEEGEVGKEGKQSKEEEDEWSSLGSAESIEL